MRSRGHEVRTYGALSPGDDPQWAVCSETAAREVAAGTADQAVVCCWTGTGASIAANKVPGVRAALCTDAYTAEGARRWNDANVLALSLRLTSEPLLEEILDAWFTTEPSRGRPRTARTSNASADKAGRVRDLRPYCGAARRAIVEFHRGDHDDHAARFDHSRLQIVSPAECLRLLASVPLGRLVYTLRRPAGGPAGQLRRRRRHDRVQHRDGDKLRAAERGDVVAFEADDVDLERHLGWTVTAIGHLSVVSPDEAAGPARTLPLHSWLPMDDPRLVRLGIESHPRAPPGPLGSASALARTGSHRR